MGTGEQDAEDSVLVPRSLSSARCQWSAPPNRERRVSKALPNDAQDEVVPCYGTGR